ncbi:MAG: hypothetical protein GY861_11425 [bacterium]|nr:hypothetical protein [bacterium]
MGWLHIQSDCGVIMYQDQLMKLMMSAAGYVQPVVIDEVFSTYLYDTTGISSGTPVDVVNNIDLDTYAGLVRCKIRTASWHTGWVDTVRGGSSILRSTIIAAAVTGSIEIASFNTDGFTTGSTYDFTTTNNLFATWTFRKSPRFFDVQEVTKASGADKEINLASLGTVGLVQVKRIDSTGSWYTWHRSLSSGKLLIGESTVAEATLGEITVSGTILTLVNGVIADGDYSITAFAHDSADNGVIQCSSFTTNGSGAASVDHGWSAGVQYVMLKGADTTGDWEVYDTARTSGWTGNDDRLRLNSTAVEDTVARLSATGTTLNFTGLTASKKYIYKFISA